MNNPDESYKAGISAGGRVAGIPAVSVKNGIKTEESKWSVILIQR